MHRECRERFPHHRLQRNPIISDTDTHYYEPVVKVPTSTYAHHMLDMCYSIFCVFGRFSYLSICSGIHINLEQKAVPVLKFNRNRDMMNPGLFANMSFGIADIRCDIMTNYV